MIRIDFPFDLPRNNDAGHKISFNFVKYDCKLVFETELIYQHFRILLKNHNNMTMMYFLISKMLYLLYERNNINVSHLDNYAYDIMNISKLVKKIGVVNNEYNTYLDKLTFYNLCKNSNSYEEKFNILSHRSLIYYGIKDLYHNVLKNENTPLLKRYFGNNSFLTSKMRQFASLMRKCYNAIKYNLLLDEFYDHIDLSLELFKHLELYMNFNICFYDEQIVKKLNCKLFEMYCKLFKPYYFNIMRNQIQKKKNINIPNYIDQYGSIDMFLDYK